MKSKQKKGVSFGQLTQRFNQLTVFPVSLHKNTNKTTNLYLHTAPVDLRPTSSNSFSVCLANVLVQFTSMAAVSPSGGSGDDYRLPFIKIKKSSFFFLYCAVVLSEQNKYIFIYVYVWQNVKETWAAND